MKLGLRTVAAGLTLLLGGTAYAHVSVAGPGTAGVNYEAVFGVGHGCEGFDTTSITVRIPLGVTSVRPMHGGAFGKPEVIKDAGTGAVTSVTWTKEPNAGNTDTDYYKLAIRMKLPDAPFTKVYFHTTQTCKDANGAPLVTEWVALEENGGHGNADAGPAPEPAPALPIVPAHGQGWNKFTVAQAISEADMATYFKDAEIVWAGTAAYSANPTTTTLIGSEPDTQILKSIPAGTEIWVKY